jgi:hypothetical protein
MGQGRSSPGPAAERLRRATTRVELPGIEPASKIALSCANVEFLTARNDAK